MEVDYTLIGKRIKEMRTENNYTQERLAEQLNVSIGYVSQVERGITKISLDLLAKISTILNCDLAFLVTGSSSGQEQYLCSEFLHDFKQLTQRDKKLVIGLIQLLGQQEE